MSEVQTRYEMIEVNETHEVDFEPKVSEAVLLRLAFFDMDIKAHRDDAWLTANAIGKSINASARQVRKVAQDWGIVPEMRAKRGGEMDYYPPYAQVILVEEILWKRSLTRLPRYLGVTQIAENIGRSIGYTHKLLKQLEIKPVVQRSYLDKKSGPKYHKKALNTLREHNISIPFDDTHYNLRQLELLTGEDREWIARRLNEAGIKPEVRRSGLTGHSLMHYPSGCLDVLKKAAESRPSQGGDWLTAHAIKDIVGKSTNWVGLRLRNYTDAARYRLDTRRVPRLHYPIEVLVALIDEADTIETAPKAEDYLSTSQLAIALGKSQLWVENRIGQFDELAEIRKDAKGRLNARYPPYVLEKLSEELKTIMSYPEAEGYLTISGLAKAIGRTEYWVKRRIARLAIHGETRRDGNNVPREHYHPDVTDELAGSD